MSARHSTCGVSPNMANVSPNPSNLMLSPIYLCVKGLYRGRFLVAPDGHALYLTGKRLPPSFWNKPVTLKGELYFIGNHSRLRVLSFT